MRSRSNPWVASMCGVAIIPFALAAGWVVHVASRPGNAAALSPAEPLVTCPVERVSTTGTPRSRANDRFRRAAQSGLNFLVEQTLAWQRQHNCYGCHVQAVT